MPYLHARGARLWFETIGSGRPVTVVAHGLSSSSKDIAGIAHGLTGTRVLFDFRGHGRSEADPGASFDQTAMADDLALVAGHAGATHAVGVSMGAASILRVLTSDDPARFEAIALLLPAWLDGDAPDRETNAHLASMLEASGTRAVEREVLATEAMRALIEREPAWQTRIRAQIRRMSAPGLTKALREYPSGAPPVNDPSSLSRVTAPALMLAHDGDPGHPADVARRLGELLPRATVRIAPKPLEMLDDMRACGRSIAAFFEAQSLVSTRP